MCVCEREREKDKSGKKTNLCRRQKRNDELMMTTLWTLTYFVLYHFSYFANTEPTPFLHCCSSSFTTKMDQGLITMLLPVRSGVLHIRI